MCVELMGTRFIVFSVAVAKRGTRTTKGGVHIRSHTGDTWANVGHIPVCGRTFIFLHYVPMDEGFGFPREM
jgi:hypothetical protein